MDFPTAADEVEVISRAYARIHGIDRSDDWFVLKLQEEVGELTQAYLRMTGQSRVRGGDPTKEFRGEVADAIAHLLLLARRYGIDVSAVLEQKWLSWSHVVVPTDREGIPESAMARCGQARP